MSRSHDLLRSLLAPLEPFMEDPAVHDICINGPGVAWVRAGGRFSRHEIDLTTDDCYDIAVVAGALSQQNVGASHPLLACDLPGGQRLQAVLPPCVQPDHVSLTLRMHPPDVPPMEAIVGRYDLSRWNRWAGREEAQRADHAAILAAYDAGDPMAFFRELVRLRMNVILTGATGSGKTTFLKTLLSVADPSERIITIENALEVEIVNQQNHVRMLYSHGDQGTAQVTQRELLEAYLRMRPDRGCVGELRDAEAAYTYVNEAMTGHPGSPSTIHGRNAAQAANRLLNLYRASDSGKAYDKAAAVAQLAMVVDCIVPFGEREGHFEIGEVWLAADAARRGKDFRELVGE